MLSYNVMELQSPSSLGEVSRTCAFPHSKYGAELGFNLQAHHIMGQRSKKGCCQVKWATFTSRSLSLLWEWLQVWDFGGDQAQCSKTWPQKNDGNGHMCKGKRAQTEHSILDSVLVTSLINYQGRRLNCDPTQFQFSFF